MGSKTLGREQLPRESIDQEIPNFASHRREPGKEGRGVNSIGGNKSECVGRGLSVGSAESLIFLLAKGEACSPCCYGWVLMNGELWE